MKREKKKREREKRGVGGREEQVERGVDELVCRLTLPGVLTDSENHLYTAAVTVVQIA